jgi:hypothetical protein
VETALEHCATCGRSMEMRRRWTRDPAAVRHCSDACRRRRPGAIDHALETAIVDLLAVRGPIRARRRESTS